MWYAMQLDSIVVSSIGFSIMVSISSNDHYGVYEVMKNVISVNK